LPWSADRPFEHLPSVEDRIDAVFRAQDALALSEERRALIDAGVLTLLPATFAGDDEAAPESLTGAPAPPVARSKVRDRITEWAHRTDIGPECMCEVCPSVRVSRRRGE
jgi:hypothetical protein